MVVGVFLLSRIPLSYFYHDKHTTLHTQPYPTASFVIPVKNEAGEIYKTIAHCMDSRYPTALECIVVDDGSTDNTVEEIRRAIRDYGDHVRLISFSENRGKREAMATGVKAAKHDIIIFVDSDSFVEPEAARLIVEHFMHQPRVGGVSGRTGVENVQTNALTKMQAIRYAVSFDIFKSSESAFGAVTCCPGCFSAYRKEALLPILNAWQHQKFLWSNGTFGDDRSLTNFVLRNWNVIYCEAAFARTIVPTTYSAFFRQQLRWKKSWIREGLVAAEFMWKAHPLASVSFYINLIIPALGPIIVGRLFYLTIVHADFIYLIVFTVGIILMSSAFGLYMRFVKEGMYCRFMPAFSLFYMFVLVWQMPYAILRITDNRWGTR